MYPSGTVTFLFTDLENSSRLWEQYPEEMKPALAQHDAILRQGVDANEGIIVKTTGDGLHGVFSSPNDALQATIVIQKALLNTDWPVTGPLRVRMGLHTGQAQLREGDYYGPAVNRAARVMSVAAGGQILISNVTTELVREQLPGNVSVEDLGRHRLRSLDRPERLYQLQHPELPDKFPPLNTLQTTPNNLPVQLSSFIGRESECDRLKNLLLPETKGDGPGSGTTQDRLITLTGPGGTGKTRLSLQVAGDLIDSFPDGVWLVELAPLTEPELVGQAVAEPFGQQEQPGRPLLAMLIDFLKPRKALIILDNCEHVIDSCAHLCDAVLRGCPQVHILASSREILGITGELAFRVHSLSLPLDGEGLTKEEVVSYEAIRLFIARAKTADPDFKLTEENATTILHICQRLDGIPLAIELAAARTRLLSSQQILDRLDDRFRLLTGGSRTVLPRQRTLQALIDWSYDLLSEEECVLLRRLAVFSGGWTLEAAESVTGVDPLEPFEILDLLASLHNKSLITVDKGELGKRYSMLETIRQYAQAKMAQSNEVDMLSDRHLAYFVGQHEKAAIANMKLQLADWHARLASDHDNYRAAQAWALESDMNSALRLAAGITAPWSMIFPPPELFHYVDTIIELAEKHPDYSESTSSEKNKRLLLSALVSAGNLSLLLGISKSRDYATRAENIAREQNETAILVAALLTGAVSSGAAGDFNTMRDQHQELGQLIAGVDQAWLKAMHLVGFGAVFLLTDDGRFDKAWADWEKGMAMFRQEGEIWGLAFGHQLASGAAYLFNQPARAGYHAERSLELCEEIGDVYEINAPRSRLADLARLRGDLEEAIPLYKEVIAGWRNVGQYGAMARCLECLAFIGRAQAQNATGDIQTKWNYLSATLLGVAAGIRQDYDSPMNAFERGEYKDELTRIKQAAGNAAFQRAWKEGLAMDPDQAIEYIEGYQSGVVSTGSK